MPGDLHYGDNLDVLRHKVATESVDLVYLDPPFNSDRTYNLLHKDSKAQQHAFVDTWHWEDAAERAFAELTGHAPVGVRVPPQLSSMMLALKSSLWENQRDTLAYLAMMGIRIVEMRRVLRATGSLYLHCDPTASHYLKMILDAVFGPENFRNEIIWKRTGAHNSTKGFGPVHDVVLFFTKGPEYTWNQQYQPLPQETADEWYNNVEEETGRRFNRNTLTAPGTRAGSSGLPWRGIDPTEKGRHWSVPGFAREKIGALDTLEALDALDKLGRVFWPKKEGGTPMLKMYLDESKGVPAQDVWTDIRLQTSAKERIGYPTQKPLALLERIIIASSNAGDLVLDPFCGCGTTVEASETLGRKWVGIDVAIRAIDVIKDRLDEKFGARVWAEYGEPSDVESAEHLADTNAYDFQWWAVRRLGGQPPKGEKKKGGDGGIDGEMTLQDFTSNARRKVVISVKGGRSLTPDMVRALDSTARAEKADYGILITMHAPTTGMRTVARECGTIGGSSPRDGKLEHRIRIITIPEILAGTVQLPGVNMTPRSQSSPPPAEVRVGETLHLPFPTSGKKSAKVAKPQRAAVAAKEVVTATIRPRATRTALAKGLKLKPTEPRKVPAKQHTLKLKVPGAKGRK